MRAWNRMARCHMSWGLSGQNRKKQFFQRIVNARSKEKPSFSKRFHSEVGGSEKKTEDLSTPLPFGKPL